MPTYDYQCSSCGHKFEKFQSIKADPIKKCPACGKNTAQRLIGTGAGLIFKGSGFYITDYRSESYKNAAKSESGGGGAGGGGGGESKSSGNGQTSGGSESKPAAKPEAAKAEAPKPTTPKKAAGE